MQPFVGKINKECQCITWGAIFQEDGLIMSGVVNETFSHFVWMWV
jgi:hypothetical protein